MTAPALTGQSGAPAAAANAGVSRSGGPRPARRALRVVAGFGVLVVLYAAVAAALGGPANEKGNLDPASAAPGGTLALATILKARGVTVTGHSEADGVLDDIGRAGGAGRTVLVARSGLLDAYALRRLGGVVDGGGDVVLVEPPDAVLAALGLPVRAAAEVGPTAATAPDCPLPEAVEAGDARISTDYAYRPRPGATPAQAATVTYCYGAGSTAAAVAVVATGDGKGRFVLLGGAGFLTNSALADNGNAALALGLLGRNARLDWVIQELAADEPVGGRGLASLLGAHFWLAALQVLVALVLLALWRGRRLGPPVPEPLPVVVRASETTEGRGRLYAAARARDLAADALRAGLRFRLADRLGVPTRHTPVGGPVPAGTVRAGAVAAEHTGPDAAALVTSLAERTGRPAAQIWSLLYGSGGPLPVQGQTQPAAVPEQFDDAALLRLAEALDDLDRQVGGRP